MSKQVYFVLRVDLDEKEVVIDDGMFAVKFSDTEEVWNTDSGSWEDYGEDMDLYYKGLEILNTTPIAKDGN